MDGTIVKKDKIVGIIKRAGNNIGGNNKGGNNPQILGGNHGTMTFGPGCNNNEGSTKTDGDNIRTGKNESGGGNIITEEQGNIPCYNLPGGDNKGGNNNGGNNPQIQGGNHGTMIFGPGGNNNEGSTKTDGGNIRTGKNESGGGNINAEKK